MLINRSLTLFATLLLVIGSYSQNKTIGSLQQHLDKHIQQDTIKVNLLNKYAAEINERNSEKAIKLLTESEKLAAALNYNKGKMDCYLQFGKVYDAKGNYEKATQYATEGALIANKTNDKKYKKEFFLLLSQSYYNKSKSVNDSIISEEVRDIAAEIKYKYFLKDSLDKTSERENTLKKTVIIRDNELLLARLEKYLWVAGVIVLILLLGFVLSLMNSRKVKMQNKQLQTEQKLRRSQMNPHFIFNSIQNVRSLIHNKQEAEAISYINKFSAITLQILESSDENYISMSEELELIENYLALQQLSYPGTFTYTITIDEEIETNSILLPPMLSQPFIENAIKHGLSHEAKNGLLKIRLYMKKKSLFFEIVDNGNGFDTSKKGDNHKSMAMEITRNRLAHYAKNQNFIVQADNVVDGHKNIVGARISFEIPYIYEK